MLYFDKPLLHIGSSTVVFEKNTVQIRNRFLMNTSFVASTGSKIKIC